MFGVTALARQNGRTVQIHQEIAGSIFGNIEVSAGDPTNPTTVNRTMLNLYAKGSPGDSHIEVVGGGVPVEVTDACPGANMQVRFVDGGFVQTFNDHSLLFYVIDPSPEAENALCITFGAPSEGVFDYLITGGAGRFEGASGQAKVRITSWGVTNELSAEQGSIEGSFQLP